MSIHQHFWYGNVWTTAPQIIHGPWNINMPAGSTQLRCWQQSDMFCTPAPWDLRDLVASCWMKRSAFAKVGIYRFGLSLIIHIILYYDIIYYIIIIYNSKSVLFIILCRYIYAYIYIDIIWYYYICMCIYIYIYVYKQCLKGDDMLFYPVPEKHPHHSFEVISTKAIVVQSGSQWA